MRELKFRVWSKLGNEFVVENDFNDGAGITLDGKFSVCNQSFFGSVENSDDYIIQQYTGLKDKNGREIYEGDILKLPYKKKLYLGRKLDEHGKDIGYLESEDYKDFYILYEVFHFNGTYGVSGDEYTVLINGFVIKQVLDTRSEIEPYSVEKNGKIRLFGLPHEFESYGAFGLPSDKTEVVGNIFRKPRSP